MSKYCFGVDVGGTTVKMGLFTPEGEVISKWEIPTRTENNGDMGWIGKCRDKSAEQRGRYGEVCRRERCVHGNVFSSF